MNEGSYIIKLGGVPFNVGNCLSGLIAAVVVFGFVFYLSRNLQLKPNGRQNVLEWIIDFTNGIVKSAIPDDQSKKFGLLAFTLFVFIFVSNQVGLAFQLNVGDTNFFKSPTSSPMTTMTLAFMVLLLAHFLGVKKFGLKGYLVNTYLRPMPALFLLSILEEFTNFLTLSLRLYGNIYSGEVLLKLIWEFAQSHGLVTAIPAIPFEILWQGFSVFIGSIQAFVFVTLTMVYISQKVEKE